MSPLKAVVVRTYTIILESTVVAWSSSPKEARKKAERGANIIINQGGAWNDEYTVCMEEVEFR